MKQVTLDELCSDVAETLNAYAARAVNGILDGYAREAKLTKRPAWLREETSFPEIMTSRILEEHIYARTRRVVEYARDSLPEERKYSPDFKLDNTVLSPEDMRTVLYGALQGLSREIEALKHLPDDSKELRIPLHEGSFRMGPNSVPSKEVLRRMKKGLQNYFAEEYGVDLRVLAMRQSFR